MVYTKISDVIVPEVFNDYVINRTTELSALVKSGIISTNAELNKLANGGGKLINMPFWDDLDGEDEVLSDSRDLVPGKISARKDAATLFMRGKAWKTNELSHVLAGSDPMAAIGDLVANYWGRRRQAMLFSILKGVFGSSTMATNLYDISGLTGTKAILSAPAVLEAKQMLGDSSGKLKAISMHSAAFTHLQKQNLIQSIPNSEGKVDLPTYLGYQVIVDDGHPIDSGVYTSYLFGQGAIGYGAGFHPTPTEVSREALGGNDILINRQAFILHPRGVKFTSSNVTDETPSNLECEDENNWERVYDSKNVRIVKFMYKLA